MPDSTRPSRPLPTPAVADFRECVVRAWIDTTTREPYWTVEVHKNLAHVFSPPSIHPGWLSDLRFRSYEDAAAFVAELRPHIRSAADGHAAMCDGARAATSLIFEESGRQRAEHSDQS